MTRIEWTDATWNPIRGCSMAKGSEQGGCLNCYAARMASRNLPGMRSPTTGKPFAVMRSAGPRWTGDVELIPSKLEEPLRWRKPRRVFVNSMSDLFHEALPVDAIDRVFAAMALAPQHRFQILTKRPARMLGYMKEVVAGTRPLASKATEIRNSIVGGLMVSSAHGTDGGCPPHPPYRPWPFVWLGVSVEDQKTADERIPLLLQTPAAVRFVSYEPALGPVDLQRTLWNRVPEAVAMRYASEVDAKTVALSPLFGLDWVIVGGESGPGARPFDVAWARSVIRQCREAGVPCFVKQLGTKPTTGPTGRFRTHRGERQFELIGLRLKSAKGGDPAEWPEDLRVREFPV
ncbi:MAG: DUF5131 family protein [Planctomycetota bacterium]|jgi:protein gp37